MKLRDMPRDPDSMSGSSTFRSNGVAGRVSAGRTSARPSTRKCVLAAILLLAVRVVGSYPWATDPDVSAIRRLQGHTLRVNAVTFSPDGQTLASSSLDSTVRIWDLGHPDDGHAARSVVLYHDTERLASAFSPDGSMLVSVGIQSLTIWSCEPVYERKWEQAGETYHSVAFSPDGRTLALGGEDGTVRLWDMPSARERCVLHGQDTITNVAFSPDSGLLVSRSANKGRVAVWDVTSGAELRVLADQGTDPIRNVAFSPDGRTIGISKLAYQPSDVILLDVRTGEVRSRLAGHRFGVESLAFSPDGRHLATAGYDRCIKLWDLATAKEMASLTEGIGCASRIAFAPDGSGIAFCRGDEIVGFWDLARKKPRELVSAVTPPLGRHPNNSAPTKSDPNS